jgi:hypothetical protein
MASLKHIEKVRAAQLDRIERKLDALLKQAGISLVETAPVVEVGEPEGSEPEGEQPEDKPRTKKK